MAGEDYAAWWFERSTTAELAGVLLDSHAKRSTSLKPGRVGLLDRGMPMPIAVSGDGLGQGRFVRGGGTHRGAANRRVPHPGTGDVNPAGVVDCEGKSIEQIHAKVLAVADSALSPSTYAEDS